MLRKCHCIKCQGEIPMASYFALLNESVGHHVKVFGGGNSRGP